MFVLVLFDFKVDHFFKLFYECLGLLALLLFVLELGKFILVGNNCLFLFDFSLLHCFDLLLGLLQLILFGLVVSHPHFVLVSSFVFPSLLLFNSGPFSSLVSPFPVCGLSNTRSLSLSSLVCNLVSYFLFDWRCLWKSLRDDGSCEPALTFTVMAVPEVDLLVVGVDSSVNIKTFSTVVSDGLCIRFVN